MKCFKGLLKEQIIDRSIDKQPTFALDLSLKAFLNFPKEVNLEVFDMLCEVLSDKREVRNRILERIGKVSPYIKKLSTDESMIDLYHGLKEIHRWWP